MVHSSNCQGHGISINRRGSAPFPHETFPHEIWQWGAEFGKIGAQPWRSVLAVPLSVFDQLDDDIEDRAIAEAEADVAAGRVYPHEQVRSWLEKLASGTFGPFEPPKS